MIGNLPMTTPVRLCPICGSSKIVVVEPNAIQVMSGVAHVLKCECGAIITLSVVKPSRAPYEDEVNDSL